MCKSYADGYKRCKSSAQTKASESLRKSITYQAKKAGISMNEWKEQNPDLLELITSTYDVRLKKFEQKVAGETLITGVQSPEDAAKEHPIMNYGFAAKGEQRTENSHEFIMDYVDRTEEHSTSLKLTSEEMRAVYGYGNNLYAPINKYFLKDGAKSKLFDDDEFSWDRATKSQSKFKNEADLLECAAKLDSALSHRSEERKTVYRGMHIHSTSPHLKRLNGGKSVPEKADRRKLMEAIYKPGTDLTFDAYSSASDSIEVAANWCHATADWEDSPTSILFEIKSSAGLPIAHIAFNEDEREVLLPRGMKFKVANSYWNSNNKEDCYKYKSTLNKNDMYAQNKDTMIVQLIEVDEKGNEIVDTKRYEAPPLVIPKKED